METENNAKLKRALPGSLSSGVVALVFLAIGYQTALFLHTASVEKVASNRDEPDTVYVYETRILDGGHTGGGGGCAGGRSGESGTTVQKAVVRKNAVHSDVVMAVRASKPPAVAETFDFNPNTVTVDELVRLGFSSKQAASIDNYRKKGGKFRRKQDFAKSYVVSDEIYSRLEPYIKIPLVDINRADSAALDALPGIGPYFVKKIISHRKALRGFSFKEQLMDIYHFDEEKFEGLKDLITVGECVPYPIWSLPADSLRTHPYIGSYAARGIVLFRENNPKEKWTVAELGKAGVLRPENIGRLSKCKLK